MDAPRRPNENADVYFWLSNVIALFDSFDHPEYVPVSRAPEIRMSRVLTTSSYPPKIYPAPIDATHRRFSPFPVIQQLHYPLKILVGQFGSGFEAATEMSFEWTKLARRVREVWPLSPVTSQSYRLWAREWRGCYSIILSRPSKLYTLPPTISNCVRAYYTHSRHSRFN